jgi:[acyl-carrier-protein] S-malonyltransferase
VVAGSGNSVETLLKKASSISGGKAIRLIVSGAFHSSLMKEASEKMAGALDPVRFADPAIPVISNWDARPTVRAEELKQKLVKQIDHPVLWEDSIRRMIEDRVETFVEVGPGKVLTGLLRKIDRKKRALNVEDTESLDKTLRELA